MTGFPLRGEPRAAGKDAPPRLQGPI